VPSCSTVGLSDLLGSVRLRAYALLLLTGTSLLTSACGGGTTHIVGRNGITDSLTLSTTTVPAGRKITAVLTVKNPGAAINLNALSPAPLHCRPGFEVVLSGNGISPQGPAFTAECASQPLIVRHGITRFRMTVFTTYNGSTDNRAEASADLPFCSGRGGGVPPLPSGEYKTSLAWTGSPLLPPPPTITVTLTGS